MGEAYPPFAGGIAGAKAAAVRALETVKAWHGKGAAGAELGRKYILGATPGAKGGALGGYVHGATHAQMRAWRQTYLAEALRLGAHGLSEFNWTPKKGETAGGNAIPKLMLEVFHDVALALGGGKAHAAAPKAKAHKPAPANAKAKK